MKKAFFILVLSVFICSVCFASVWSKSAERDEFGDETGDFLVSARGMTGEYSSTVSGVENGYLKWAFFIDSSGKTFFVFDESGKKGNLSTAKYVTDMYEVKIKLDNGEIKKYEGQITKNGSKYNLITLKKSVLDVLLYNTVIKIVVSNERGSYSLGSVPMEGFTELYYDKTLYNKAYSLIKSGNYIEARTLLDKMKEDQEDSYNFYSAWILDSYAEGLIELSSKDYKNAWNLLSSVLGFEKAREYRDSIPENEIQLSICDYGISGGIIFYDKGEYTDGWRYLESAPFDLHLVEGEPSVDYLNPLYRLGEEKFLFGFYRKTLKDEYLYVNGTKDFNSNDCTSTAVGEGSRNTDMLVNAMGESTYTYYSGEDKVESYAAKLCNELVFNGYDDWFLPSKDELDLMNDNLKRNGLGGFAGSYWSSSEDRAYACYAWKQNLYDGIPNHEGRDEALKVRPARAF